MIPTESSRGPRRLEARIRAPRDAHDAILRDVVAPFVRELREEPRLTALSFLRYHEPDWEIRVRACGEPEWLDGAGCERLVRGLAPREDRPGHDAPVELSEYRWEDEALGDESVVAICERLFSEDTIACLELLDIEARGALARSRRELSLLMNEWLLDLMDLDPPGRLEAYRHGFQGAVDLDRWTDEEAAALETRYSDLKDGIGLLLDPAARHLTDAWGGPEAATIARRWLDVSAPILERLGDVLARTERSADAPRLACAIGHLHANRLGVEATPEAILRYFAFRFHQDRLSGIA